MTAILEALQAGHDPRKILEFVKRLNPKLAKDIAAIQASGYGVEKILDYLIKNGKSIDKDLESPKGYRGIEQSIYGMSREAKNVRKTALTAASLAGGYGLSRMLTRTPTLYAPEILPAQGAIGATQRQAIGYAGRPQIGMSPRGLPAPKVPGGSPPVSPAAPAMPTAATPAITPATTTPAISEAANRSISLAKGLNLMPHIATLRNHLKDPSAIAAVLYNQFPKEMAKLQKNAGKPMEEVIGEIVSTMPEPQEKSLAKQPQQEPIQSPARVAEEAEPMPIQQTATPEATAIKPKEKISELAFGAELPKKLSEAKPLSERSFAIPTYKLPSESPEEFKNREIIDSAIEKAAQAISEGKTFLDFPEPWGKPAKVEEKVISRGPRKGQVEKKVKHERFIRSLANDVLRFMAGVPNVYDPLLDDDEREELNDALEERGMISTAALPTGDLNVYGAQQTPNLVWNMLLTVEPRLQEVEIPKSVKGYKTSPGGKMGSAELRRFMTHAVYGALSGKKLSTKLKDKIGKISGVANHLDVLAKAVKEGNLRQMIEEQERLLENDEEFFNLFTEEVFEMARKIK